MSAIKTAIRQALRRVGYDLHRYPPITPSAPSANLMDWNVSDQWVKRLVSGGPIETIFDVGANLGDTVALFRAAFPESTIYAFEPSAVHRELRQRLAGDMKTRPILSAVGSTDGETTIYEHAYHGANSLLPDAPRIQEWADPRLFTPTGTRIVPITRLDTFCATHHISRIDILKIDVQGYERHVLNGAGALLNPATIRAIFLEVLFVDCYQQQAWPGQIFEDLRARGYRLFGMTNINVDETNGWKFADAMFIGDS